MKIREDLLKGIVLKWPGSSHRVQETCTADVYSLSSFYSAKITFLPLKFKNSDLRLILKEISLGDFGVGIALSCKLRLSDVVCVNLVRCFE